MKKKDDRIQALEAALQSGSRMEIVRRHGTIEDLVAKVATLEDELRQKEKEVHTFQSLFPHSAHPTTRQTQASSQSKNQDTRSAKTKNRNKNQIGKAWQSTPMYESDTDHTSVNQIPVERTPKRDHCVTDSDDSTGRPQNKISNANASTLRGGESMSE